MFRALVPTTFVGARRGAVARIVAALLIAATAFTQQVHAHGVTLVLQHYLPADSTFHTQFLLPWLQKLEKESAGLLRFRVFPAMQHGGQPAQLAEQVGTREIDIALTLTRHAPGRYPAIEAFEALPVQHKPQGASRAAWEYVRMNDLLDKEFEDTRLLGVAVSPSEKGSDVALLIMNARSFKSLTEELRKVMNANSGADTSVAMAQALGGNGGSKPAPVQFEEWIKRAGERGVNAKALGESARELMAEYDTGK